MRRSSIFSLLIFIYPFAVYFGLNYFSPRHLALGMAIVMLLRLLIISPNSKPTIKEHLFWVAGAGIITSLLTIIFNQDWIIKLYPVLINLLLFGVFFYSALYPPTIIERLVKIKEPNLPDTTIKYIRKVTLVWCVFFITNGSIALWTTLFATAKIWAFYNGFLSYILIGVLFATEFTYRQWVKRKNPLSNQ